MTVLVHVALCISQITCSGLGGEACIGPLFSIVYILTVILTTDGLIALIIYMDIGVNS